jgi:hypothetical protein
VEAEARFNAARLEISIIKTREIARVWAAPFVFFLDIVFTSLSESHFHFNAFGKMSPHPTIESTAVSG